MLHRYLSAVHTGAGRWDHKCVSGFDRRRTYLSAFLFATETQQTIGLHLTASAVFTSQCDSMQVWRLSRHGCLCAHMCSIANTLEQPTNLPGHMCCSVVASPADLAPARRA